LATFFVFLSKENDKDISMEVLYNYFENFSRNNFDDGYIDIESENCVNLLFKTAENIFTNT
jgi:hypothetical protein